MIVRWGYKSNYNKWVLPCNNLVNGTLISSRSRAGQVIATSLPVDQSLVINQPCLLVFINLY